MSSEAFWETPNEQTRKVSRDTFGSHKKGASLRRKQGTKRRVRPIRKTEVISSEATVGFEPTNKGFAISIFTGFLLLKSPVFRCLQYTTTVAPVARGFVKSQY